MNRFAMAALALGVGPCWWGQDQPGAAASRRRRHAQRRDAVDAPRSHAPGSALLAQRRRGRFLRRPSLAVGGNGRLYAVWSDDRTNPIGDNHDIYLSYSTDGGVTWSADILVNDMPSVFYQRHASIAVVSGGAQDTVVVTWSDQRSPYYDVRSAAFTLP